MKKMTGHPRLFRRSATYYHRASIPVDIRDTYEKSEETFSLHTKDYQEAIKLVRIAAVEIDKKFDSHRKRINKTTVTTLTKSQLELVRTVWLRCLLEADDEGRLIGYEEGFKPTKFIHTSDPKIVNMIIKKEGFKNYIENKIVDTECALAALKKRYGRGLFVDEDYDDLSEVLELDVLNIALAENSPSEKLAIREMQVAQMEAYSIILERFKGEYLPTQNLSIEHPEVPSYNTSQNSSSPLISIVANEWVVEKSRSEWTKNTSKAYKTWIDYFISITGDKPLDSFNKADGRLFKTTLINLPSNWTKNKLIRHLSISEASKAAKEFELEPMSNTNINKIIGFVIAFWNWAKANYDDVNLNPVEGLKLRSNSNVRDARHPFSLEELNSLFSSPVYKGCLSKEFPHRAGEAVLTNTANYWLPLIALYSGMRMGEILQLYVTDIQTDEGIAFININSDEDKTLKNAVSNRNSPIHPKLIELGFLDFVALQRQDKQKRLFPEINRAADGTYTTIFSKWFSNYLSHINLKHKKITFHSLRHNFEDACRTAKIDKAVMDSLQGHTEKGMSGRYGSGYDLQTLYDAIVNIDYKDLVLPDKHQSP